MVSIAKSKLTKRREEKNEKVTKPEELVRLYDLLLQVDSSSLLVSNLHIDIQLRGAKILKSSLHVTVLVG